MQSTNELCIFFHFTISCFNSFFQNGGLVL